MTTTMLRAAARRLGVLGSIITFLGLFLAPAASAHTELLESTPAKDARISGLTEVTLVFSEPVTAAKVLVRDAGGTAHQSGDARTAGAKVIQAVDQGLPPGRYTVAFRVVSADGHPVQDAFAFTLNAVPDGSGFAPASATPEGTAADAGDPGRTGEKARAKSGSGSGAVLWVMIIAGLVAGIGIGALVTVLRKRPHADADADAGADAGAGAGATGHVSSTGPSGDE